MKFIYDQIINAKGERAKLDLDDVRDPKNTAEINIAKFNEHQVNALILMELDAIRQALEKKNEPQI